MPPKEPRYDGSWLVGVVVAVAMLVVVVVGRMLKIRVWVAQWLVVWRRVELTEKTF